jgi:hypothetical protein
VGCRGICLGAVLCRSLRLARRRCVVGQRLPRGERFAVFGSAGLAIPLELRHTRNEY